MTKLIYPEEGLAASQLKNMEIIKSNLDKISEINFDIPNSYEIGAPLKQVLSDINYVISKHNELHELLETTDNNYNNVSDEIANNFKVTYENKITKREKII